MGLLVDVTPLRLHPNFRRLYVGNTLSGAGATMAATTIGLQVYDITRSSFAVGLVGLFGLIPLIVLGLYGGAILDAYDRRAVAIRGSTVMWVVAILNVVQAALGNTNEWVLYALVALNSAAFGVVSPARQAIYPRILELELLPAANALSSLAMSVSMLVGPVAAGYLVDWSGYVAGGPRLGDVVAGTLGELALPWAALAGGVAGVIAVLALARAQSGFLRYDSRDPRP